MGVPVSFLRTCNALRTVMIQTFGNMFSTSSPYGRPYRCSVSPSRRIQLISASHFTPQSAKCSVSNDYGNDGRETHLAIFSFLGFLPVIVSWLNSKRKTSSVQLPTDTEPETDVQNKVPPSSEPLSGWKILLLWIPAACDLTGTTVSRPFCLFTRTLCIDVSLQLMNVGLLYTPVSIYQMTRGSLVLFVAFLSVTFLRRRLWFYQ